MDRVQSRKADVAKDRWPEVIAAAIILFILTWPLAGYFFVVSIEKAEKAADPKYTAMPRFAAAAIGLVMGWMAPASYIDAVQRLPGYVPLRSRSRIIALICKPFEIIADWLQEPVA